MPSKTSAYTGPSFSFQNRLGRLIWKLVYLAAFRFTPRPFHSWRRFILQIFGAKVERGCHIYPKAIIWAPWNLICHEEAGVADGVTLYNQAPITLGRRSVISQGTYLCTGSHDYTSSGFELFAKPITVGNQAWIAAECFVHPGVTIAEGAVIGARSVVTEDMPPWSVCAGHPCRVIKPRVMKAET